MRYTADLDLIADHVRGARRFGADIDAALAHLDRVVADLHLSWTGLAADAHASAHAEWVAGAKAMREALAAMSAAAQSAHASYEGAALANLEAWGPLG